jgi:hypothetical protein
MTKYLSSSPFSSPPSNENYRQGWENTFESKQPLSDTLVQCPRCGCYFQRKGEFLICPNLCVWETCPVSDSKFIEDDGSNADFDTSHESMRSQ